MILLYTRFLRTGKVGHPKSFLMIFWLDLCIYMIISIILSSLLLILYRSSNEIMLFDYYYFL